MSKSDNDIITIKNNYELYGYSAPYQVSMLSFNVSLLFNFLVKNRYMGQEKLQDNMETFQGWNEIFNSVSKEMNEVTIGVGISRNRDFNEALIYSNPSILDIVNISIAEKLNQYNIEYQTEIALFNLSITDSSENDFIISDGLRNSYCLGGAFDNHFQTLYNNIKIADIEYGNKIHMTRKNYKMMKLHNITLDNSFVVEGL